MPDQELMVETKLRVSKSPEEVFEAIVNPEQMSGYFTTSGTGRLDAGGPVTWKWDDCGAELLVTPKEVETGRRVSFLWSASGSEALVVFDLERADDGGTTVNVSESGWPRDAEGTARSLRQMQGWVHMLCCMKAYLEHGINLRQ